ncbi:MAG: uracil-DNA glycosylase family protein [Balneolales bacterium]
MTNTPPTFARKILNFNKNLHIDAHSLPAGIRAMNPFSDDVIQRITGEFYKKFYSDHEPRSLILGINPGRLGSGATGVAFTDTERLRDACGIDPRTVQTREPSSTFIYKVIAAMGGPQQFYSNFYISSVCPLGFVINSQNGNEINYNYYDNRDLQHAVTPFIIESIERQMNFGINTSHCFCMGKGKNFKFLNKLNKEHGWFDEIMPLNHPRFVVQYRSKQIQEYVQGYVNTLML